MPHCFPSCLSVSLFRTQTWIIRLARRSKQLSITISSQSVFFSQPENVHYINEHDMETQGDRLTIINYNDVVQINNALQVNCCIRSNGNYTVHK